MYCLNSTNVSNVKNFRFRKIAKSFVGEKHQGIPYGQGHPSSEGKLSLLDLICYNEKENCLFQFLLRLFKSFARLGFRFSK